MLAESHENAEVAAYQQGHKDGAEAMRTKAAKLMLGRKVTASEFYSQAIMALPILEPKK
jgi:hypothetical protein